MSPATSSQIDVLVIGAGPAGLMLATWLARLGTKTRIVDKRFSAIHSGQADGLQSRTFEIFDSLGIGQDIWREANHMLEIRFWNPDKDDKLYRSSNIVDSIPGLSRFQQATLHQARIEEHLFSYISKWSEIKVERGIMPESLKIDIEAVGDDNAYPVTVTLRHLPKAQDATLAYPTKISNGLHRSNLTADNTETVLLAAKTSEVSCTETVHAKYVVGCDGAHSWTRRQIGSVMEGEQSDYVWGVLDIIPITDFPDIRYRCAIHSSSGSMMIIPREKRYVRLYIQVTETDEEGKPIDRFKLDPGTLLKAVNRVLHPYILSYKHCHWWTAYRIGQRVGSKFSAHDRVFLAGDAVHTHSPKAGQGMNISMHDTYNLGWKIGSVVNGWAESSLLGTYSAERRQIAQELIDFDHKFSRLFSGRPAKDIMDSEGVDLLTFKSIFEKGNLFASGCAVDYASSLIVAKPPNGANGSAEGSEVLCGKQSLASKIPLGMRIPSHKILNQADARPWHLQERLPSSGAWRLLVFAGDILDPVQFARYESLGKALASPGGLIQKYKLPEALNGLETLVEIITIHSSPRVKVELPYIPEIFHPFSAEYGWDYEKIFVDDQSYHEGHGKAYENYGIDPRSGALVIVRPDQYVSWIGDLNDVSDIERFFSRVIKVQTAI